ncbi:hypothetical protein HBB16_03180 [Pseudonocardia sp. MCCB 268]|nr:hypothetical protein [Pseudonocardia cytotoxica]
MAEYALTASAGSGQLPEFGTLVSWTLAVLVVYAVRARSASRPWRPTAGAHPVHDRAAAGDDRSVHPTKLEDTPVFRGPEQHGETSYTATGSGAARPQVEF